ncbi:hypothetical protein [Streptomyces sp. TR06-5]|uniref:hypothetical protein n=1 Tax=unclassified Streptomyces TaxID=2593676 RepID=UPI0039A26E25
MITATEGGGTVADNGRGAGVFVAGVTALAFAVVGFLAYRAGAAQDGDGRSAAPGARGAATASASPGPSADPARRARRLPADSGQGERVVYALDRDRVWLVGPDGEVERTYRVWPGTVDPEPGRYEVTSRTDKIIGTDGVVVEHVVVFGYAGNTVVGFSAAVDGSTPHPDPSRKTGGVRERTADGEAMWAFGALGTPVVVVR